MERTEFLLTITLTKSEKSAKRIMRSITNFLEEKLRLKVNVTKSKIDRPKEIKYLGFGFYWDIYNHQFKARHHQISIKKLEKRLELITSRSPKDKVWE